MCESINPQLALLGLALLLDRLVGDPVYPGHPVRIMGALINRLEPLLCHRGKLGGLGLLLFGLLPGLSLGWYMESLTGVWWWVKFALLYSLLGYGDLVFHVKQVNLALKQKNLSSARRQVGFLVGRDTGEMDEPAICRASLESLAENFSDGFLAPLFWYLVAGFPGLIGYKWVSTLDSMVGYKTKKYLHYGYFSAKADDGLNFIPSRLSWLVFSLVAFAVQLSGVQAAKIGFLEHHKLASPNSGWPEAAMAGALQVRLLGPVSRQGVLEHADWLGPEDYQTPTRRHLDPALRLTHGSWVFICSIGLWVQTW